MWRAEERLVANCMKERGFEYRPVPADDSMEKSQAFERVARSDVSAAKALGYGLVQALTQGELPISMKDPNDEVLAALPPEQRRAFHEALRGPATSPTHPSMKDRVVSLPIPGGGTAHFYRDSCLAEARSQLYGDDYEDNELGFGRMELERELASMVERDAEVEAASSRWRNCMKQRGQAAASSDALQHSLVRSYRDGTLTLEQLRDREIAAATADSECYVRSNGEAIERAAKERAERELVDRRQDRLVLLKTAQIEALERAEELIEELEATD